MYEGSIWKLSGNIFEIAENYKDAKESKQADLANRIIKEHNRILKERELCYKIKDLQPSKIYQNIYRRAQMDQSRQMNKRAHDESFLHRCFLHKYLNMANEVDLLL